MPVVTIAIPTRDSETFLAGALESIPLSLEGCHAGYEVVIADGRSKDRTLEIAQAHANVRVVSSTDAGLYDGMNKAIAAASGDLVLILNSDDRLLPGALAAAVETMTGDTRLDFASGDILAGSEIAAAHHRRHRAPLSFAGTLFGVPAINARLFRTAFLRRAGRFRTDASLGADRELLLRALREKPAPRSADIGRPLYFYRSHGGSQTIADDPAGRLRVYRSDVELARLLLGEDALSARERELVRAFLALAQVKLRRAGARDEIAMPAAEERLGVGDFARGLWLYGSWRGVLSGY